jgi:CheY-like chemotaxis protein
VGLGSLLGMKRARPLVLHIDDSPLLIETTKAMLVSIGCDVISALNGEEGLALARKNKPDLILVDAMMPGIDGYTTTRALKADAATSTIPVVMLTGNDQVKSVDLSHSAGADGYIVKPIQVDRLSAKLKPFLWKENA